MSLAMHASFKLRVLNCHNFCIEIVLYISITFHGDVLFQLPPLIDSHDGPSDQMQGMDRKHDGHVWYKVKMTNIKNDFNSNEFSKSSLLGPFVMLK
jgi:hypothetical protein